MNTETVVEQLIEYYGRDVFAEASARMRSMSKDDLMGLVLVACNRMGTAVKGADYDDEFDAAIHVSNAIIEIFSAYDNAYLSSKATINGQEGNA